MQKTIKSSISFQRDIWDGLQKYSNRSRVVNRALSLFFAREDDMERADAMYWKKVEDSLSGKNREYTSLNPKGKELDETILDEGLWK